MQELHTATASRSAAPSADAAAIADLRSGLEDARAAAERARAEAHAAEARAAAAADGAAAAVAERDRALAASAALAEEKVGSFPSGGRRVGVRPPDALRLRALVGFRFVRSLARLVCSAARLVSPWWI